MLKDRTKVHGNFSENSRCTWAIMGALAAERNWPMLNDGQRHAMYMIAHKMARIMAGDPSYLDHWDDIAGYATCVTDVLRTGQRSKNNVSEASVARPGTPDDGGHHATDWEDELARSVEADFKGEV